MMNKPTVLLGMINDAGIAKIVAQSLTYHGFEVIDFSLDSLTFQYPDFKTRLLTQWQKLLGNSEAKKELMVSLKRRQLNDQLARHSQFDYALFIRSDVYPESFLREIKNRSQTMVNYQWDGLERFSAAAKQMMLFDRFYVFDPDDLQRFEKKVLPATSFYFDHFPELSTQTSNQIYFLGAHREDRKEPIIRFCQHAETAGWHLDFQIACPGNPQAKQEYPVGNIRFHEGISYLENINLARSCRVLSDFVISTHKGLSLRTFEALGYRKKLITTNTQVAKYDFYHPDNIYIWDGKSFDGMSEFLASPYHEIDETIRQKYSFGNWIRYILNIEPNQTISLPQPQTEPNHE